MYRCVREREAHLQRLDVDFQDASGGGKLGGRRRRSRTSWGRPSHPPALQNLVWCDVMICIILFHQRFNYCPYLSSLCCHDGQTY
ncbi:hypothetical protein HanRHA438_Chr16g0778221 [Helianthus annuus]|nr:hypothetical protein HanRHA438_Chr16g0778221 [Helianthus annuus]